MQHTHIKRAIEACSDIAHICVSKKHVQSHAKGIIATTTYQSWVYETVGVADGDDTCRIAPCTRFTNSWSISAALELRLHIVSHVHVRRSPMQ